MAVEPSRQCGYRKVGGIYLIGEGKLLSCDRLPLPIVACATCGERPRFNRGISKINPQNLWDMHQWEEVCPPEHDGESGYAVYPTCPDIIFHDSENEPQHYTGDVICLPPKSAYLMWVGTEYTPASFAAEALFYGVSKRIPRVPKDLHTGDWVYLAQQRVTDWHLGEGDAIFYVFQVSRVEKMITDVQASDPDVIADLEKRGIVPFVVPANDPDHNTKAKDNTEGAYLMRIS